MTGKAAVVSRLSLSAEKEKRDERLRATYANLSRRTANHAGTTDENIKYHWYKNTKPDLFRKSFTYCTNKYE